MFDIRARFAALARKRLGATGPSGASGNPYERGVTELAAGRHAAALSAFEAAAVAATTAAERANAHNKRGVAYIAAQQRAEAERAFSEALLHDERCAAALTNLGNLLFEDGAFDDAVDYYEAAIRADERYHVAYRNLGVVLKRLGRHSQAVRALRSAARLQAR